MSKCNEYSGVALTGKDRDTKFNMEVAPNRAIVLRDACIAVIESDANLSIVMNGGAIEELKLSDPKGDQIWNGSVRDLIRELRSLRKYRDMIRDAAESKGLV